MALLDYALTDLASVKLQLGIDVGDISQDPFLEQMINEATDFIERYCKRRFKVTAYAGATAEIHDGLGIQDLFLKQYPVISVEEIRRVYSDATFDVVDPSYYKTYKDGYIFKINAIWLTGRQNYHVDYTAGEFTDMTDIPKDLQGLANSLSKFWFNNIDKDGINSEKTMNYSVTYTDENLPPSLMEKLDVWKRIEIGSESI